MEITARPALTKEQGAILDLHSILNLLNVAGSQLYLLGKKLGGSPELIGHYRDAAARARNLADPAHGGQLLSEIPDLVGRIRQSLVHVDGGTVDIGAPAAAEPAANSAPFLPRLREALDTTLSVLVTRSAELLARADDPFSWREFDPQQLQEDLLSVLKAMELASARAYLIVTSEPEHGPDRYLIALQFGQRGQMVRMPAVFPDVIRDLVANARKYTKPGGRLTAELAQQEGRLDLRVRDSGIGIPRDAIQRVTQFGFRASNVSGQRTFGGGFGLTKALWVTRECGGRMWIDSPLDNGGGTEVRISIPLADAPP